MPIQPQIWIRIDILRPYNFYFIFLSKENLYQFLEIASSEICQIFSNSKLNFKFEIRVRKKKKWQGRRISVRILVFGSASVFYAGVIKVKFPRKKEKIFWFFWFFFWKSTRNKNSVVIVNILKRLFDGHHLIQYIAKTHVTINDQNNVIMIFPSITR